MKPVVKKELRSEIVMPTRADTTRMVAVGVGCALFGAGTAMLAVEPTSVLVVPAPPAPATATATPERVTAAVELAPAPIAAPDPRASEIKLVFQAGGATYMSVATIATAERPDGEILPRHAKIVLHDDDGRPSTVAEVADVDVPAAHRVWRDRELTVDGTCTANVTGFAVVSRLVGEPAYAGVAAEQWTAASVFEHGTRVLAARLDGCADGLVARDAALSPVVVPRVVDDERLAAAAKKLLIDSEAARETQVDWIENGREGMWHMQNAITAQVLAHPKTGARWVSVHGHADHECGGPTVNVWGLFRVEPNGKLTTVQLRQLGDLHSIEKLVDLEGDGELELIGRPWLGLDVVATRAGGEELARLGMQYYSCPC